MKWHNTVPRHTSMTTEQVRLELSAVSLATTVLLLCSSSYEAKSCDTYI